MELLFLFIFLIIISALIRVVNSNKVQSNSCSDKKQNCIYIKNDEINLEHEKVLINNNENIKEKTIALKKLFEAGDISQEEYIQERNRIFDN